jgi:hypothetical protein
MRVDDQGHLAAPWTAVEVETLHHESHEACYIANTVKTEILIEGQAEGLL